MGARPIVPRTARISGSTAPLASTTGTACFTETRSDARRCAIQSAVMIETIDADDAWWAPTFTLDGVARTLFAWRTIDVASQSTRRCNGLQHIQVDFAACV